MNPEKLQSVQQKLEAFLAQEKEQKERAQRCFVSYLRSIYLMKNKEVFDVFKLPLQDYAVSLGLAVAPRVRFLNKAQAQKAERGQQTEPEEEEGPEEEEEMRSFKAQLRGNIPDEEDQNSESEDEDSGDEQDVAWSRARLGLDGNNKDDEDDDDDEDLRDLDLLTIKRKDVFSLTENEEELEPSEQTRKKLEKLTKFKEAKKVLKRNFQVNTKVTFSEEGQAVQLWPPVQRAVTAEEEEEEEDSGINVEKARERLKKEDQEFDKEEYRRKVKAKHTEKRLKEKAARREASKQHRRQSDEEDEVVAYLANQSEDEFDPSTLPDPDKLPSEEDQDQASAEQVSSSESSDEDDEELTAKRRKRARRQEDEDMALDTGLSLAKDEELVLHLLGGSR